MIDLRRRLAGGTGEDGFLFRHRGPSRAEGLENWRTRNIVEIPGKDDRQLALTQCRRQRLRLLQAPGILLVVEVDGNHPQQLAADRHHRLEADPWLAVAGEEMHFRRADRMLGKNGLPVFAAVVIHRFAEYAAHPG